MPPGRPRGRPAKNATSSTAKAAAAPQSRLSFGPKNATNKITKPAATTQSQSPANKKLSPKQKRAIADAAIKPQISEPTSPSPPSSDHDDDDSQQQAAKPAAAKSTESQITDQLQQESQRSTGKPLPIRGGSSQADVANASKLGPRDVKEVAATKVSDAQIKKYWKRKENDRIAARVHQRGLSMHEKVLREFDLSSQFGVGLCFCFCFSPPPLHILCAFAGPSPVVFLLGLGLLGWMVKWFSTGSFFFFLKPARGVVAFCSSFRR